MFFLNPLFQLIGFVLQLLFWGLVVLVIVAVIRALSGSGPREDEVAERWSALIPGRRDSGQEFLDLVQAELDARNSLFNGFGMALGAGLTSAGQPAIRIVYNTVFSCFISYEQVGKDLHLTWTLHEKTTWLYSIPFIGPMLYRWWSVVSILDRNKVLAFSAFTLDCTRNVAESLMDKFKIDKTGRLKESSGKLGPL